MWRDRNNHGGNGWQYTGGKGGGGGWRGGNNFAAYGNQVRGGRGEAVRLGTRFLDSLASETMIKPVTPLICALDNQDAQVSNSSAELRSGTPSGTVTGCDQIRGKQIVHANKIYGREEELKKAKHRL